MNWKPGILLLILGFMGLISCTEENPEPKPQVPTQEQLEDFNKRRLRLEAEQIDKFVQRRGWEMTATGTGLRYSIYEKGDGERAELGMRAVVRYEISLLDGTICYKTEGNKTDNFLIGEDYVETGVHEGIQLLQEGDRAKFILPAHLAHGLLGDYNKIPPQSPVLYDIELVQLIH